MAGARLQQALPRGIGEPLCANLWGVLAMFGNAFVPIGQGSVVIKSKTLDEALKRMPCRFVSKDGEGLNISNVP